MTRLQTLEFGRTQIERLLQHRPPLLLVDRVTGFAPLPHPRLRAEFDIDGTEPVLAGHFPGDPIWPGVMLIEGLAQAGGLTIAIGRMGSTLGETALDHSLASRNPTGWLVRVNVDLRAPVRPPATIVYEVTQRGEHAGMVSLEVAASVGGQLVGEGRISIVVNEGAR